MITIDKIEIYKRYKGYYDGYHIQNRSASEKEISDEEWNSLNNFIQDLFLIRKGSASNSFEVNVMKRLKEECENIDTIKSVLVLEKFINEGS